MADDYKLTHTGTELDNAIKAVSNGVYRSGIYVPTGTTDNLTFTLTDAGTVDETYGSTPIVFGSIKGEAGEKGQDGVSVSSVTTARNETGKYTTVTIVLSNGSVSSFNVPDGYGEKGESGNDGADGEDGKSYKLAIDSVSAENLPAGSEPQVNISETSTTSSGNIITTKLGFEFKIPKGDTGEQGEPFTYEDFTEQQLADLKGEQGIQGIQGIQGEPGHGLQILGTYGTLEELKTTVSAPSQGDMYHIGAVAPYTLYMWDTTNGDGEWVNLGELQGPQGIAGIDGVSAGFGTPIATITGETGTPSVTVTATGPDTAKVFSFAFENLKGADGRQGIDGVAAGFGTPTASIDNNVGTPSVEVTATGEDTAKVFNFDFKNLKGDKGIYVGADEPTDSTVDVWIDTSAGYENFAEKLKVNGKEYNGSKEVEVGVIAPEYGGTGKTNLTDAMGALVDSISVPTTQTTLKDSDYMLVQTTDGTTKSTIKKTMLLLWTYIKSKIPSWSLNSTKPTYTASEVGAEASGAISTHNSSSSAHSTLFNTKVDKVTGKTLSTNDYTTEEKTKLAGIEEAAQKNVSPDWSATSGTTQILNKPTIPSIQSTQATLTTSGWSSNQQTVSVAGITTTSIVITTCAASNRQAWLDAEVYCSAQGTGTLTFTCSETPSENIIVNIVIMEEG